MDPSNGQRTGRLRIPERASQYPRVTLRLPPETLQELDAIARAVGRPQWQIVYEAVRAAWRRLCHPMISGRFASCSGVMRRRVSSFAAAGDTGIFGG